MHACLDNIIQIPAIFTHENICPEKKCEWEKTNKQTKNIYCQSEELCELPGPSFLCFQPTPTTSEELQTKQHNMCWLVLEYICLPIAVFSKQQGVGSVDLPPTDCSPRSAVKINAQTSTEQVDPRWMHRGYKILESDHRFWRSVSCHCCLNGDPQFSDVPPSRLLIVTAKQSSSFYHTDYFQHDLHLKAFSLFILQ